MKHYMIVRDLRDSREFLDISDTMIHPFEQVVCEGFDKKSLRLKFPNAIDLTNGE